MSISTFKCQLLAIGRGTSAVQSSGRVADVLLTALCQICTYSCVCIPYPYRQSNHRITRVLGLESFHKTGCAQSLLYSSQETKDIVGTISMHFAFYDID